MLRLQRESTTGKPTTVADLLKMYRRDTSTSSRSRAGTLILSQLSVLTAELGQLPATALERPDAIEDFKARYANRAIATTNRYLARLRHICNWAIGRDLLTATPFHRRGVRIVDEERAAPRTARQRSGGTTVARRLQATERAASRQREADLGRVREIRARAQAGVPQRELAATFKISRPLCNEIVRGHIWNPDAKLTTGDEMRDRIIGALDTGCRRGEMMKIQNKHVDWRHRWIRILKENSKTEVARVIPFEPGSRLEKLLRRRAFLGPDAYVFGEATTGEYVASLIGVGNAAAARQRHRANASAARGQRLSNRDALARIDLHWHDLRHEALSRLADDGVPVHELQMLAGHASITTTQRYMNARANSLAESMRQARERRVDRIEQNHETDAQVG